IGIIVLVLGIPIGKFLAKVTREELKQGKKWFRWIIIISLIGALINLVLINDILLFSFLFIAVVTYQSWRGK
ncbi:MAG: hypothetical protein KKA64_03335, partial [Nanoarchaeota archaeon]|nr:hypothetical protein [Nanoarchaeota archaeon]